jgi:hypothetical protein
VEGHHGRHKAAELRRVVVGAEEDIQAGRRVVVEEDNPLVGRMVVPGAGHMAVVEEHRKVPAAADSPAVVGVALAVVDRRANVVEDMENGLGEEDTDSGGMGLADRTAAAPLYTRVNCHPNKLIRGIRSSYGMVGGS